MAPKLTAQQQARLAWLNTLPPKFERARKVIELMATNHADDSQLRSLLRLLGELKAQASTLSLTPLAEGFGYMETLLRRTGGLQLRVRGLRELLAGVATNYEGAVRAATTPQDVPDSAGGGAVSP